MEDFIKIESTRNLDAFHKRYLFYDGLVKNIHYSMADKSLFLTIECRDSKEQWLLLTILINGVSGVRFLERQGRMLLQHEINSGVSGVRFLERQGNQEIISTGLRIIKIQNTGYLLTLDDESIEDPQTLQKEGYFVVVGDTISYHENYHY